MLHTPTRPQDGLHVALTIFEWGLTPTFRRMWNAMTKDGWFRNGGIPFYDFFGRGSDGADGG